MSGDSAKKWYRTTVIILSYAIGVFWVNDARADAVVATIPTGLNPYAIAADSLTNMIYVANYSDNTVTVINGLTNATATVPTGSGPSAVAVNQVTNMIYVANYKDNTVTVINGTTNATATVAAGSGPLQIAVNPVTNMIYVANYDSTFAENTVTVINGATNETNELTTGSGPCAVAVNPVTNMVYVTNFSDNTVTVINGTTYEMATVNAGAGSFAVAVNPVTNMIYVANYSTNTVTVINGTTKAATTVTTGANPTGVAVNSATNMIYVADYGDSTVTVINGTTNATTTLRAEKNPYAIAVDQVTNMIYVVNNSSNTVTVINGITSGTTTLNTGVSPWAVTVNPLTNKTYVANYYGNSVTEIEGAPLAPVLALPTNGASNQATTLTLSWESSAGATSYGVQVSTSSDFTTGVVSASENTAGHVTGGLSAGITYYWRVNATSPGGTSSYSGTSSFSVPSVPGTPTTLATSDPASAIPVGGTTLTWVATGEPATSYGVQVSTSSDFTTGVVSTSESTAGHVTGGLSAGITYYWRVNATNPGGTSSYSGTSSFSVPSVPGTPTTLATSDPASAIPVGGTTLTWVATGEPATSYGVQVSTSSDFTTGVVSASENTAGHVTGGLSAGITYYWRVNATNPGGTSSYSGTSSFSVPSVPGTPTTLATSDPASAIPVGGTTLTWVATGEPATSYGVQVSTSSDFTTGVVSTSESTAGHVTGGLSAGITYYWRVNATNPGGTSLYSGTSSFSVPSVPEVPVLTSPDDGFDDAEVGGMTLTWDAADRAVSYTIELSTSESFGTKLFSTSQAGTSKSTGALTIATTYFWRVNAANPGGTSDWCTVQSFTVPLPPGVPSLSMPLTNVINQPVSLSLSWNALYGADFYTLQIATVSNFSTSVFVNSMPDTFMTMTNQLGNLTKYYWRVNATGGGGTSNWSAARNFTTIIASPGVPTLSTPTDGAGNQAVSLSLSWSASTGGTPASYAMQVSTISNFSTSVYNSSDITGTHADVSGLANSTIYYWRVNATNVNSTSAWAGAKSFTTIIAMPGVPTLSAPANAVTDQPALLTLSWAASITGGTPASYALQVSTSSAFGTFAVNEAELTSLSKQVASLGDSVQYYWHVRATNAAGDGEWSSMRNFTTIPHTPAQVTLSAPRSDSLNTPTTLTLSWSGVEQAASYALQVSTSSAFGTFAVNEAELTSLSKQVASLGDSVQYYWHVRATNAAGDGQWSASWNFTTIPHGVSQVTLSAPRSDSLNTPTTLTLSWSGVEQAASYALQVSTSSAFGTFAVNEAGLTGVSLPVGPLGDSVQYYWHVRATNVVGEGEWSSMWNFTTIPHTPAQAALSAPRDDSLNTPTTLTLSWSGVEQAASYALQVSTSSVFGTFAVNEAGLTSLSKQVASLGDSIQYYWHVRATNAAGDGEWSTMFSFTTIPHGVSQVTLSAPRSDSLNTPTTLTLSWSGVEQAASYALQVSTSSAFGTFAVNEAGLTGVSLPVGPLGDSVQYYWHVRATNVVGDGEWSSMRNFTTIPHIPAQVTLSAPRSDSLNTPTTLTLSWSGVEQAASYALQVSTSSGFGTFAVNEAELTSLSKQVASLGDSIQYYWHVRATNAAGDGEWSTMFSFTTIPHGVSQVTLSAPRSDSLNTPTTLTLSWSGVEQAASYALQVSTSSAFGTFAVNEAGLTGVSLPVGPLGDSVQYYWHVRATNAAGDGQWSASWNFTTIPRTPAQVTLSAPRSDSLNTPTTLTLSWNGVEQAASYALQVSTSSAFGTFAVNEAGLSSLSKQVASLGDSVQYYWHVRATNAAGDGQWSASWNFTTIPHGVSQVALSAPRSDSLNTPTTLTLSWSGVEQAASYALQVSTSSAFETFAVNEAGLTSLSKQVASLGDSVQYYWHVRATNAAGDGQWSAMRNFTTIPHTPTQVTLSAPRNDSLNTPTTLTLSWSGVEQAASYALQVSTSSAFGTFAVNEAGLTSLSKQVASLGDSIQYYWHVRAANAAGDGQWSASWNFTTIPHIPAQVALSAPRSDSLNTPTTLTLSWSGVEQAASYALQVSTSSAFGTFAVNEAGLTGVSLPVGPLSDSVQYYWHVRATNAAGDGQWSASWNFTTIPHTPTQVTLSAPRSDTLNVATTLTLSWNGVEQAASYALQVSTSSAFGIFAVNEAELSSLSKQVASLGDSVQYYWHVRATNAAGDGQWSSMWNFTTIPHTPAQVTLSAPRSDTLNVATTLTLSWNGVEQAASYALQVSTSSAFGTFAVNEAGLSSLSKQVASLGDSVQYYWHVRATNAAGDGQWSASWNFTTIPRTPAQVTLSAPRSDSLNTPTTLTLSWSGVEQAASYALQVSTSSAFGTFAVNEAGLTGVSLPVGPLGDSVQYYWHVRATNVVGDGEWSSMRNFTTIPHTPAQVTLSAPRSDTLNVATTLTLSWSGVEQAASYALQVSTSSAFGTFAVNEAGLSSLSKQVASLGDSVQYLWHVRAKNAAGDGQWSSMWNFTTIPHTPTQVTLIAPRSDSLNTPTTLTLSWSGVEQAASYALQVSTSSVFGTFAVNEAGLSSLSKLVASLGDSIQYYWHVRATNAAGDGQWSLMWNFTTIPHTPAQVTLSAPRSDSLNTPTTLTLSWSGVEQAASYALQVSASSAFGTFAVNEAGLSSLSKQVASLGDSLQYYWHVRATNVVGDGQWSASWNFTTIPHTPTQVTLSAPRNDSLNTPTTLTLSWSGVEQAASYALQVSTSSAFGTFAVNEAGLTSLSKQVASLGDSVQYFWHVRAKNAAGDGQWSASWNFTTIPHTPTQVTLSAPRSDTLNVATTLTLSWSGVEQAASYALQVSTSSAFGTFAVNEAGLSSLSKQVASLGDSVQYYWHVRATNAAGDGQWSLMWNFTTIPHTPAQVALSAPRSDSLNTPTTLTLSWSGVEQAASYALQVSTSSAFGTFAVNEAGLTSLSKQVASLGDSVQYFWHVRAKNAAGDGQWSLMWNFTTIPHTPAQVALSAPRSDSLNTPTTLTLSWSGVEQAASYALQVSTSSAFGTFAVNEAGLSSLSKQVESLGDSVQYFWHVRAKNAAGDGQWSLMWNFTTIPHTPAQVTLSAPRSDSLNTPTTLTLSWSGVSQAAFYKVQVSTNSTFAGVLAIDDSGVTTLSRQVSLSDSIQYYWHVRAKNAAGSGEWSDLWNFTTIPNLPAQVTVIGVSRSSIMQTFSWDGVPHAASYTLQVSTSASFEGLAVNEAGLSVLSLQVGPLNNNTFYYWHVRATNAAGDGQWSIANSFTTIAVPSLSSPSNAATWQPTSLTLSWQAVSGASTYQVKVSTVSDFLTTIASQTGLTSNSFGLSNLSNATTYFWKVYVGAEDGPGGWSNTFSFATMIATPVQESPANNVINQPLSLNLSWSVVDAAASYAIQISATSNFTTTVFNRTGLTGTSIAAGGITYKKKYYWQVNATDGSQTTLWSGVWNFTISPAKPGIPSLTSPANALENVPKSPTLAWGAVGGAASYTLNVSTDAAFATTVLTESGVTSTSLTIGPLQDSVKYYWIVNATNAGGTSNWSDVWNFTTIPHIPAQVALSAPRNDSLNTPTTLTLSWSGVSQAASYKLQVSTNSTFAGTLAVDDNGLTTLSQQVGPLADSVLYYWQVRATNAAGDGQWSASWNFTTIPHIPAQVALSAPRNDSLNTPTTLTLSWSGVEQAASYALQVSTSSAFGTLAVNEAGLTGLSLPVGPLGDSVQYYWHVRATNVVGDGEWSSMRNFTTIPHIPAQVTLSAPRSDSLNTPTTLTLSWSGVEQAASYALQVSTSSAFGTFAVNEAGLTSLSKQVASLGDSVQYYWHVRATNAAGDGQWSASWNFTTIPHGVSQVTLSAPRSDSLNTPTTLTLSWSGVEQAASYALQVSTSTAFGTFAVNAAGLIGVSLPVGPLGDSVQYYWHVRATNVVGDGEWSSMWNFTTIPHIPAQVALSAPRSDSLNTPTTLTLSWSGVSQAASYKMQVSTNSIFTGTLAVDDSGLTTLSRQVGPLTDSVQYYWQVRAKNAAGSGEWSAARNFTTIPAAVAQVALSAPRNDSLDAPATLTLSWTGVAKAASYALQVSTSSTFTGTLAVNDSGLTMLSQQVGPLADSVQHFWHVRAKNAAGDGEWSTMFSFTTIPHIPAQAALSAPRDDSLNTPTTLTLSWSSVEQAASYALQVSTNSAFGTFAVNEAGLTSLSKQVASLGDSVQYFWHVRAKNAAGDGQWSASWNFTTIPHTPTQVTLSAPRNDSLNTPTTLTLSWSGVEQAASYALQVSTSTAFGTLAVNEAGLTGVSLPVGPLGDSVQYYWHVRATNVVGDGEWSSMRNFTTIPHTPAQVTLSAPRNDSLNTPTTLTLSWSGVEQAASYALQVSTSSVFGTFAVNEAGLTSLSKQVASLGDSVQYYWHVRATNAAGDGQWSASWNFTTIPHGVSQVTLSAPRSDSLNTPTTLTLSWSGVEQAASYALQVSTSSAFGIFAVNEAGLTGLSLPVGPLSDSVQYYWHVRATNVGGDGEWSSMWNFTTIPHIPAQVALSAPRSDSLNTPTTLTLSWSGVSQAASYKMQVSTNSIFTGTLAVDDSGLTTLSRQVGPLTDSVQYYWQVRAKNAAGSGEWSAARNFTTIPATVAQVALSAPRNDSLDAPATLTLSWTGVAKAASYALQVSTSSAFTGTLAVNDSGLTMLSQQVGPLADSVQHFWHVRAKNAAGDGEWSTMFSFTTIPHIPAQAALSAPRDDSLNTPTTLTLSWSGVEQAASYALQVSTSSTFGTFAINEAGLTSLSKQVASLGDSVQYYWHVRAKNAAGDGEWASTWNFTTIPHGVSQVTLIAPRSDSLNTPTTLTLSWSGVEQAASYELQVSTNSAFGTFSPPPPPSVQEKVNEVNVTGLTGLSLQVGPLYDSVQYYWHVRAKNAAGDGEWSSMWNFTTIPHIPEQVALSAPRNDSLNTATTLTLSWSGVEQAASYALQVSTNSAFGTFAVNEAGLTSLSKQVASLGDSIQYYWHVRAANAAGDGQWSASWNFTTIPHTPAQVTLSAPRSDTLDVATTLTLSWSGVEQAASYALQVSTSTAFGTFAVNEAGLTSLSKQVASLSDSVQYYWHVRATNVVGDGQWSSMWNFTTIPHIPSQVALSAPTTGTLNTPTTLTLSWSGVSQAASFALQVSTSTAFGTFAVNEAGLTGLSLPVGPLSDSVQYYWHVRAANAAGPGSWSDLWDFTTIPTLPIAPVLALPANGDLGKATSLTLSWNTVSRAASYGMQVSTVSDFSSTVYSDSGLATLTKPITGLSNNTVYFWHSNAKNAAGTGIWAGTWSFTTVVAAPVLAAPSDGAAGQPSAPSLTWGSVGGATSYSLMVSTSSDFLTTVFGGSGITATSQVVGPLANNTVFFWKVNAANAGGSGDWSAIWSLTSIVGPPALSFPTNNARNVPVNLTLAWSPTDGATSYVVQVATNVSFGAGSTVDSATQSGTTRPVSSLAITTKYFWRVRAMNADGTGAWSVDSFTTITPFAIPLKAGWNMISLNIHPVDSSVAAIYPSPKSFILIKDNAGNVYVPSDDIDVLHVLHTGKGYQAYTQVIDTIRTGGSVVDVASTPISLSRGWAMIGYLPQVNMSIITALAGIEDSMMFVKNNEGRIYWPYFLINDIGTMKVGMGYQINMLSAAVLTYPTGLVKRAGDERIMLSLPDPQHYRLVFNTGNNATILAKKVGIGGAQVADSCEIAAFNEQGKLVGSGTVIHGLAAFSIWGNDTRSKTNDGCADAEKITFKLWDGTKEYPLDFVAADGEARYAVNAVFVGALVVPEGCLITKFALSKVYPNPFRGYLKIAFDVPTLHGVAQHDIEINLYDMKGSLVQQIVKGQYRAGHYTIAWSEDGNRGAVASGVYIIRMKARDFDKRMKLIRVR